MRSAPWLTIWPKPIPAVMSRSSNEFEAGDERPFRLKSACLEGDRIDGRRRSGISLLVFDGFPDEPFRLDDLQKYAVDRELRAVGGLHDVEPGAAGSYIHLADRARESLPAVPLRDMLRIRNGFPDKFTRRVEHSRDDDDGLVWRTGVDC